MTITDLIDAIDSDETSHLGGLPRVLVIDDDETLLRSLSRVLRGRYDVQCESNPWRALVALEDDGPYDAIVSDLTMPGLDGIDLLAQAHAEMPQTPRILLTGNATLPSSIDAVNRAHVTTFLTKPVAPSDLISTLDRAVAASDPIGGTHADRQVRDTDLSDPAATASDTEVDQSADALLETLALANPAAHRLTERVATLVDRFVASSKRRDAWELTTAARLCYLGNAALGPDLGTRVIHGADLTEAERLLAGCVPAFTVDIVARIPRISGVEAILRHHRNAHHPDAPDGAAVLFTAVALIELEASGLSPEEVVATLRADRVGFDTPVAIAVTDHYLALSETGATSMPRSHAELHLGEDEEIIELFDNQDD